jgi:type II secretory pathway component HofQ
MFLVCVILLLPQISFVMEPYAFEEKERFPEHNNFFMPSTNDVSYVPRNLGKIGVENDLKAIARHKDYQSDRAGVLDGAVNTKNISSQDVLSQVQATDAFEDERLKELVDFSCTNIPLHECLRLLSYQSGLLITCDAAIKNTPQTVRIKQQSIGTLLKLIAFQHDPHLELIIEKGIFCLMPHAKAYEHLNKKNKETQQSRIIPIKHARVDENFIKKIQQGWDKINLLHSDARAYIHVDADEKKVFARGAPSQLNELQCYITEVDEPIVQIKIDAILVIAEKNFNFDFGFDWSGIYNRQQTITEKKSPFAFYGLGGTLMDFPTPDKPVVNPPNRQQSTNIFVDPLNFALNLFNSGIPFLTGDRAGQNIAGTTRLPFVFGGPNLSLARLNVVLNAAESDAKLKIVSRPSVLTSNNEIAKMLIGKSIPLQTTIEDLSTSSTRNITTINFKDVGTMIEVKPTVSADKRSVFLDIIIEDSAVTSGSTKTNQQGILIDPPTVSVVKVKNRVQLKTGQTTIIGGLSYQLTSENRNMVPWFWKIPFLGYLFQATFSGSQDRERYIFLTPTIIVER